jgi:hypothetical protein
VTRAANDFLREVCGGENYGRPFDYEPLEQFRQAVLRAIEEHAPDLVEPMPVRPTLRIVQ